MKPQIDAIALPHGYSIEWGGDAENSSEAQQAVYYPAAGLPGDACHHRPDVQFAENDAIWLTVPLALIGVTPGFLITGIPLGLWR